MPTRLTAIGVCLLTLLALTAAAELGEGCITPSGTIYIVHLEGEACIDHS